MTNGYIRFIAPGTQSHNSKTGLFGTSSENLKDPNTIILRAFNRKIPALSEELYNLVQNKISEAQSNTATPSNVSSADELKKFK